MLHGCITSSKKQYLFQKLDEQGFCAGGGNISCDSRFSCNGKDECKCVVSASCGEQTGMTFSYLLCAHDKMSKEKSKMP
jgi:hypothetical protein